MMHMLDLIIKPFHMPSKVMVGLEVRQMVYNGQYNNHSNWATVNSKSKKIWRKIGENNKFSEDGTSKVVNVDENPFDVLAVETNENPIVVNDTLYLHISTDADYRKGANIVNNSCISAKVDGVKEVVVQGNGACNGDQSGGDKVLAADDNFFGNLFDKNMENVNVILPGLNSSSSNTATSKSVTNSATIKSCTRAQSGNKIPPPAMVSGAGLTFLKVNTSLASLSSAMPTSSIPSSSSKSIKLKGKFWDDLDEGHDYIPEDVLPLSSGMKSGKIHTRRNPI